MKIKALSVRECAWTSEECHPAHELQGDSPKDRFRLPNLFRSKKVKPLTSRRTGPTYQVYHTARELLLEALDRGAVRQLVRRAAGVKPGASRSSQHHSSREQGADLSEEQYAEALTWFSVVLQGGLSFGSELTLKLDGWQGVLKRNSFQNDLLSLTRLEDTDKLDALSAFCGHLARRYQALYTPGHNLAVKKYRLSYQQGPCSLHLALLCDTSSGLICNMYLYCPQRLRTQTRTTVVELVVEHLLRPFCSHRHRVQLDSSASGLADIFSGLRADVHFAPTAERSPSSPPRVAHQLRCTPEESASPGEAHLQGWTGPALFPLSDPKGSAVDVFLPGLWVTLHVICINTFTLHSLQREGSGSPAQLTEFTRTLACRLAEDSSVTVPVLSQLHSRSCQEAGFTNHSKQRSSTISPGQVMEKERPGCSSAALLHGWNRAGVCGLDNSGNSCYLNAVLQCLCSTVPLVEHLLNRDTRKELGRSGCQVAQMFVRLLEEMWLGCGSSCAPAEARSVMCSVLPQFDNYSQQDAQELMLFLLNALNDELKKVAKRQMLSSVRRTRRGRDRSCGAAAESTTIISRLFEGQLGYTTLCTHCDHQTHSTQTFTVLSLPIPKDTIKCSIEDCLSLFFGQTILTAAERVLCSVCGLKRETAVHTSLDKPPEILMLHLKRFSCKGRNQVKLRTNVLFASRLDLSPFLSSSIQNTFYSSYRLYAVVNHTGHLNMGHYTALCHNACTRSWHCFDDSAVREVQDSLVQSPNAYVLLYSHKPFQKPKIHGL